MKPTPHALAFPLRRLALALSLALTTVPVVHAAPGDPVGPEFRVNTGTANTQSFPSIAGDADGDFVVAWNSFGQDGSDYGIYAQRYAADGTPQGKEFRVNTTTASRQNNPSVAMDADGDFVVAWQSVDQNSSGYRQLRYLRSTLRRQWRAAGHGIPNQCPQ